MASVDLTAPEIANAYEALRKPADADAVNWLVLGYRDTRDQIFLYQTGDGGVEELCSKIGERPEEVLFCMLSVESKILLVTHLPDGVGGVRRARALVHSRAISGSFRAHSASLTISTAQELSLDIARHKLRLDGGPWSNPASPYLNSPNPGSPFPSSSHTGAGSPLPGSSMGASPRLPPPGSAYSSPRIVAPVAVAPVQSQLRSPVLDAEAPPPLPSKGMSSVTNGVAGLGFRGASLSPPTSANSPRFPGGHSSSPPLGGHIFPSGPPAQQPHRRPSPSPVRITQDHYYSPGEERQSSNGSNVSYRGGFQPQEQPRKGSLTGLGLSPTGSRSNSPSFQSFGPEVPVARTPSPRLDSLPLSSSPRDAYSSRSASPMSPELEAMLLAPIESPTSFERQQEDPGRSSREYGREQPPQLDAAERERQEAEEQQRQEAEEQAARQREELAQQEAEKAKADAAAAAEREEEERKQAELERERVAEEEKVAAAKRAEEDAAAAEAARVAKEEEERLQKEQAAKDAAEREERRLWEERERLEKKLRDEEEARAREEEKRLKKAEQAKLFEAQSKSGEVMLRGHVSCQDPDSIFWKRRWFELRGDSLKLYKNEKEVATPVDTIQLGNVARLVDSPEEASVANSWKLVFKSSDDEPWLFYTNDKEEKEKLVDALKFSAKL